MTEVATPYRTTPSVRPNGGVVVVSAPPEIEPRLRVMLIAVRRALLLAADAIGDYLGLEKRE